MDFPTGSMIAALVIPALSEPLEDVGAWRLLP